jgi:hypothetical protein
MSCIYFCINELNEIDRRVPVIPIGIQLLNFFWKRIYFLVPTIIIVLRCNWLAWIFLQTHSIIFIYSCHKSEVIIIKLFERKVWKIVCNNNIFKNFRNMNSNPKIKYFCGFFQHLFIICFKIQYCVVCVWVGVCLCNCLTDLGANFLQFIIYFMITVGPCFRENCFHGYL